MQRSPTTTKNRLNLFILVILFTVRFTISAHAAAPIPVVATLPILQDLVEVAGLPHVTVSSLISGFESEHTYTPKPSDLILIQKAKVLFQIGLGLEVWVNPLIKNAGRANLPIITTSEGVSLIQDPEDDHPDHDHPAGNPHIWLDPQNVKIMMRHISEGLSLADPDHRKDYEKNTSNYIQKLETLEKELETKVDRLKEKKIITHHPAWPYFAQRFGFEIRGNLLTQIGSEPSAKKIGGLIRQIKKEGIRVIVSEPQLNPKIPQILAEETGVTIVPLSPLPGAIPGTTHYLDLIRYNVEALVSALEKY